MTTWDLVKLILTCGMLGAAMPDADATRPPVTALAVAPDGQTVLAGSQAGLRLLNARDLSVRRWLPTDLRQIHDIRFSPDGRRVAVAGGSPGQTGGCEILSWPSGDREGQWLGHDDATYQVAWDTGGRRLATCGMDGVCFVVPVATIVARRSAAMTEPASGRRIDGHSRGVLCTTFLPGADVLLTGSVDQTIRVWNLKRPHATLVRTLDNHTDTVVDLAVRPAVAGGPPVVASAGSDQTIRLWQPTIGRLIRFVRLKHGVPSAITWTPDGQTVVAVCDDGHLRSFDYDELRPVDDIAVFVDHAMCVAACSVERWVVVGGVDGQIKKAPLSAPR